jgi:multidrug resistance efflux pump
MGFACRACVFPVLALTAVLAGGCTGSNSNHSENGNPPAAPGERKAVVGFGNVDLENGVTSLSPINPGRVASVDVEEGREVAEGQVLLRLEDQVARLRVDEARSALEAARKQLTQTRLQFDEKKIKIDAQVAAIKAMEQRLDAARYTRDHQQKLRESNLVAEEQLQVAKAQVKELEAQLVVEQQKLKELQVRDVELEVSRAESDVQVMASRLKQAEENLKECVLKAPERGTVLRILVAAGDLVNGQPKFPAIQFLPLKAPWIIRVELNQEFGHVEAGQKAQIEDYYDAHGFKGTGVVKRVSGWYTQRRSSIDDPLQFKDARTMECVVDRLQSDGDPNDVKHLRIGQRMRVTILKAPS